MQTKTVYPPGVPCWVDVLVRDPNSAREFYSALFGWTFAGPGPMPEGGGYYVARANGLDVAGLGAQPKVNGTPTVWTTYVRVDDVALAAKKARAAGGSVIATFDALPAGRGAVLACPRGSVFGVWQPDSREGAQHINAPNAWAMSALRTDDIPGAVAFYGAVFGWEPEEFGTGAAAVTLARLPGYVGGTAEQPVPRDVVACFAPAAGTTEPAWGVDFWVDDADVAAARAKQLCGRVIVAPFDTPLFRQSVLADREGATFSVSQLRMHA